MAAMHLKYFQRNYCLILNEIQESNCLFKAYNDANRPTPLESLLSIEKNFVGLV